MIASLSGVLQQKRVNRVVLDVQGVGYLVQVSAQTLAELPDEGQPTRLCCYTYVREDALQLFGFAQAAEQQAFELLIMVSGVGPKVALTILSGIPVAELVTAIAQGNHARLQTIPGIGKRTAERLVVELQDRFDKLQQTMGREESGRGQGTVEVIEALVNLGYRRPLAERVVEQVTAGEPDVAVEILLRKALAAMAEG